MGKIFYGWYVAIACCIGMACGLTSVLTGTFPIFLGPLLKEFQWTQTQIFTAVFLATLTVTIASPFIGMLIDRFGAKRMILISFVLEGIVFASLSTLDSLAGLYGRYIVVALVGLGTSHVSFSRIISLWFDRRRGLALGITLAGLGLGGMTWAPLSQWAISAHGWRTAYLIITAVVTVIGFLAVALVVRESPASMGLQPDGDAPRREATAAAAAPTRQASGFTLAQTMRQPGFWVLLLAFLLVALGTESLRFHLVPLLKSQGVEPMRAALAFSVVSAALIAGRLAGGFLMDRFFASRVASAFLIGPIVGIALLAGGASGAMAFVAAALLGLALGAEVNASAFLAGRYFGVKYFSTIYAWFFATYSIAAGFGPTLTAMSVQHFGGYTETLYLLGGFLVIAALLFLSLKRFPQEFPA